MCDVDIQQVDHQQPHIAAAIHAVHMAAYAQEAALLGVSDFPPLSMTAQDIRQSEEQFFAAFDGETIIGAVSVEPPELASWSGQKLDHGGVHIASLIVHPQRQREGVGLRLMEAIIAAHGSQPMTVSTALANTPALALYEKLGFVRGAQRTVGNEPIEIVLLRRG